MTLEILDIGYLTFDIGNLDRRSSLLSPLCEHEEHEEDGATYPDVFPEDAFEEFFLKPDVRESDECVEKTG